MAGSTTRSESSQSFFVYVRDAITGIVKRVAIPSDVQVGLAGRPAELQLFGRLSVASTTVVVDAGNKGTFNVSNNDTIVAVVLVVVPTTGRIRACLPPTPREGQLHFIKDMSGTAGSVPIDIVPPTGVTIDDEASKSLIDNYGSLALVWLDGQWRMLVAGLGSSGGSGAPSNATYVTIGAQAGLTQERHLTGSTNLVMTDQGANASVYLDLTRILAGGAGSFANPTVTVDEWGRITSIAGGAAPTPNNASYITVTNEPALTDERALAPGTGLRATDGGAGGSYTIGINDNVVATVSGSRFTGPVVAAGGLSGSLQRLSTGTSYLVAGSNVTITSQSNGQVVISSTGGGGGGSALPLNTNVPIVAGVQVVDQVIFQAVGAFEFNPDGPESMAPSGSTSYTAYFQPIVEVFPTGVTLEAQLYNVTLNSYIAASLLTCSTLAATRLKSPDLAGSLATGTNTYEMHMRITNAGAGKAVCKGAKLFVTWN